MNPRTEAGPGPADSTATLRIKICGLTRAEDARAAVSLGAHYLGFIFASSPRRVTPEAVRSIVRELDKAQGGRTPPAAERVGVFVNADRETIEETVRHTGLTMVQLHGEEDPGFCTLLPLPVIKALRVRDRRIFDTIRRYSTPYILLEPYVPGKRGGTGVRADWTLAAEIVRSFPDRRFFLAGGLGPENVRAAAAAVRPFAVDASSALEGAPGLKDAQKLRTFFEAVRNL